MQYCYFGLYRLFSHKIKKKKCYKVKTIFIKITLNNIKKIYI